mmetsp:Transcript_10032/g.33142  ORF Transcript_10032/g.33142 Transcript_10032/m.33142 type:complete len:689 (-) Transcript_10032:115-2181(-)
MLSCMTARHRTKVRHSLAGREAQQALEATHGETLDVKQEVEQCETGLPVILVQKFLEKSLDVENLDVEKTRMLLKELHSAQMLVQEQLHSQLAHKSALSSRKGFLKTLEEQLGPATGRLWRAELFGNADRLIKWGPEAAAKGENVSNPVRWLEENLRMMVQAEGTKVMEALGWDRGDAEVYQALAWPWPRVAIARSLSTGDPCFSACAYTLCDAMFRAAASQSHKGLKAPRLFRHLQGKYSLAEADSAWNRIEEPDATGFCGLTSPVLVKARIGIPPDHECFSVEGFMQWSHASSQLEAQASDIVCFVSSDASDQGFHTAILTEAIDAEPTHGVFPPNTLFRLLEVKPPGSWTAPNGVVVKQMLLVVSATFRCPTVSAAEAGANKLCGSALTLQYGDRSAYIAGLGDVIDLPVLSMSLEFDREMKWRDRNGVEYTLRECWAYVNGPAIASDNCTPGVRDERNAGKTPTDFLAEANSWIKLQRDASGGGKLPEEFAFLTLDEVLGVRLYSGPAYEPINTFLRQVMRLTGEHRRALARSLELTFAATVGHIVSAIRKLAAVATVEEARRPLYRAVRGDLARGFWSEDSMGFVCALDTAFMSTSRNRQTPISYMGEGANVLWEIEPREESDSAYHCGADISMLSQFGNEEEVLFPPCCLLVVTKAHAKGAPAPREENGKSFVAVAVQPSFV